MGSGVANLTVDPTNGLVVGATMETSIGSQILDNATLSAFRRWRFKPGQTRFASLSRSILPALRT